MTCFLFTKIEPLKLEEQRNEHLICHPETLRLINSRKLAKKEAERECAFKGFASRKRGAPDGTNRARDFLWRDPACSPIWCHIFALWKEERETPARADSFEAQWLPANELLMPPVSQERDTSLCVRQWLKREKMLCRRVEMCWKNKQHNRFARRDFISLSTDWTNRLQEQSRFLFEVAGDAAAPLWLFSGPSTRHLNTHSKAERRCCVCLSDDK
jgi:hypothetical protein